MEDTDLEIFLRITIPTYRRISPLCRRSSVIIDKVEIVRRHNVEIHRRARIAVFVAAVAGFVTGVIFMLFMPNLTAFSARLVDGMARMFEPISLIQSFSILPWLMTAFASVFVAMGAYEVSIALQRPRHKLILP